MRLLPVRRHHGRRRVAARRNQSISRAYRRGARRTPLPLWNPSPDHRGGGTRGISLSARLKMSAASPLLISRVDFHTPGQVVVRTGKVELGQGIWAALTRMAATALQVAPERIVIPPVST